MAKIYDSIIDTVGGTPLVRLNRLTEGCYAGVLVKLEFFNPLSSVKDRIGVEMVLDAERRGTLQKGAALIEPTSGNTGIALAFIAAARGYRLILTMPETMSNERKSLLKALGAELILTPGDEGMKGAMARAEEILHNTPGAVMLGQFANPANPEAHRKSTAVELWDDTDGTIDILVAGVGTGGTITGISEEIKKRKKDFRAVAVEPENSAVISGEAMGPHKIQGIGAGFIPQNLNRNIVDEIIKISDEEAGETARRLAREEGIFAGISSGANVAAALKVAKRKENNGKVIVAIVCDTGERYLSTWLYRDN